MPKVKPTKAVKLKAICDEYPDLRAAGEVLFCNICSKEISGERTFLIKQHIESARHVNLKNTHNKNITQLFLPECTLPREQNIFNEQLCKAFLSADIPLFKMRNTHLKNFFEDYTRYKVPSESLLRSKYANSIYQKCLDNIRECIKNQYLWISIDETTDANGRNVANVIVGVLHWDEEIASQKFLINTVVLNKTNHSTIAQLFDNSVKILDVHFNKNLVLLFVTDAAPYMVKAAKAIAVFYPKVTHVTCIAHGLHRLCERIRDQYESVNKVIANVKKVFLKAPNRIEILKEMYPDLSLPPEPVITRWGTWLAAVNYYAENYERILQVLTALNSDGSQSIKIAKEILTNTKTKQELIFIAANFGFIEKSLKKLQTTGLTLVEQYAILTKTVQNINKMEECNAKHNLKTKLQQIISKNEGLNVVKSLCEHFTKEANASASKEVFKYNVQESLSFKYAPITSVDVERTFSMYKSLFRCNRQRFLFENLSQYFVIYCNNNYQ